MVPQRRQVLKGREVFMLFKYRVSHGIWERKKVVTKVAEVAIESCMKKVGDKAGEYDADMILSKQA